MKGILTGVQVLICAVTAQVASAGLVDVSLTGAVTDIGTELSPYFAAGEAMSLNLTYDDSVPEVGPGLGATFHDAYVSATVTIGPHTASWLEGGPGFLNYIFISGREQQNISFRFEIASPTIPEPGLFFVAALLEDTAGQLQGGLPASLNPRKFLDGRWTIDSSANGAPVRGSFDGISRVGVSEPPVLYVAGLAIMLLLGRRPLAARGVIGPST